MSELLSIREYARRRGVSHVAVMKAAKQGRITLVNKKVDPATADRDWANRTDPSNAASKLPGSPPATSAGAAAAADTGAAAGSEVKISYATQRAIREGYLARLARLEYEEKSGRLISKDQVRVVSFNAARSARDRLMAIPARICSILAGLTDEREIERALDAEIRKVCDEFAQPIHS